MNNFFEHKGYLGTIEYSEVDDVFYGKVLGIKGLILYEGNDKDDLKMGFEEMVNEYISDCKEEGIEPQKPEAIALADIQIPIAVYRRLYSYSISKSKSPSQTIEEAISSYITA